MAIVSSADKATEKFYNTGKRPAKCGWQAVSKIALRKLDMLDYAAELSDLKSPPNNKQEALKKELKGFHSIRINDQWRIIFLWTVKGPTEVQIVDYH